DTDRNCILLPAGHICEFFPACLVYFFQQTGLSVLLDQGDGRLEGNEVAQLGHHRNKNIIAQIAEIYNI
ncbi:hypothetical protein, partial [Ruminococcus sp.]|uniref:hypothetical protein n=1 Tax=Ruminococcus sp. TaxID=41978 RepID=UPI003AB8AE32